MDNKQLLERAAITPISAYSTDENKRDIYRLLNLVHAMAGALAVANKGGWQLARTQSDPMYGPIITVWTNGIVDIEAETTADPVVHFYRLSAAQSQEGAQ